MYDLIIRTTETKTHAHRYYGRDIAEMYFEMLQASAKAEE